MSLRKNRCESSSTVLITAPVFFVTTSDSNVRSQTG
jgi:hypothetical protein